MKPSRKAVLFFAALLVLVNARDSLGGRAVQVKNIDQVACVKVPRPAFSKPAVGNPAPTGSVSLVQVSARPNQITDEEAWFTSNKLDWPVFRTPDPLGEKPGNIPAGVPETYRGAKLVSAARFPERVMLIYGNFYTSARYVFAYDETKQAFTGGFDFEAFAYPPGFSPAPQDDIMEKRLAVEWVVQEGKTLYVSYGHNGYAAEMNKMTGYVSAVDVESGKILWSSRPLVSNAHNFVLLGDVIVCGYGFTAEPDFLYLLDKKTGAVLRQVKLKSGPEFIIRKGAKLFVRCYDTDYVFEAKVSLAGSAVPR